MSTCTVRYHFNTPHLNFNEKFEEVTAVGFSGPASPPEERAKRSIERHFQKGGFFIKDGFIPAHRCHSVSIETQN